LLCFSGVFAGFFVFCVVVGVLGFVVFWLCFGLVFWFGLCFFVGLVVVGCGGCGGFVVFVVGFLFLLWFFVFVVVFCICVVQLVNKVY
jgi:hypothetical protein